MGNSNGTVAVYDAAAEQFVATYSVGSVPRALTVDTTNGVVYVADGTNNRIEYFSTAACEAQRFRGRGHAKHRLGRQ